MVYKYRDYDTIEGFWDKYHFEYQDIYDRFALTSVEVVDDIQEKYGFTDKNVLDIGSGTGKSTFRIAQYANNVTGIEPSLIMREYAEEKNKELKLRNVKFIEAVGEDLSQFSDNEFDCAVSIHSPPIIWEGDERSKRDCDALVNGCVRIVKPGGYIGFIGRTPGFKWDHLVGGMNSFGDLSKTTPTTEFLKPYGFTTKDIRVKIDFGTMEEALATYGFIYGEQAIDYILDNKVTKFSWMLRLFHRSV